MTDTDHPLHRFLKARAETIMWMKEKCARSDSEIAELLSMDEKQVYLIVKDMEIARKEQQ